MNMSVGSQETKLCRAVSRGADCDGMTVCAMPGAFTAHTSHSHLPSMNIHLESQEARVCHAVAKGADCNGNTVCVMP